jgi:hypothetical protein
MLPDLNKKEKSTLKEHWVRFGHYVTTHKRGALLSKTTTP